VRKYHSEPEVLATVEPMRCYQGLANKTCQLNACIATAIALKGLNEIAQGNALGTVSKNQALKGRKAFLNHCALSGLGY
jgi:hypothetical protein